MDGIAVAATFGADVGTGVSVPALKGATVGSVFTDVLVSTTVAGAGVVSRTIDGAASTGWVVIGEIASGIVRGDPVGGAV
jgi:hypothetical protein